MPLENLHITANRAWALWKITEDEPTLVRQATPFGTPPPSITNSQKRLEFLAARVLVRELLRQWNIEFEGLIKDEYGKPFLKNSGVQLSLSHSYPYVAAVTDRHQTVGIDLEQPKGKLLRIAPRILHETEQRDAGQEVVKHCVYWCAKESLIKIYGKKDLIFSRDLRIDPFPLEQKGKLTGRIITNGITREVPLQYIVDKNYVLVLSQ